MYGGRDPMTSGMLPEPESRWPRIVRTLAFWVVIIVGSIALVQYASNRRHDAVAISYNQFVQELDRGNIAAVEITEGGRVRGEFKSLIAGRSPTTHHFAMILPSHRAKRGSRRSSRKASTCGVPRRSNPSVSWCSVSYPTYSSSGCSSSCCAECSGRPDRARQPVHPRREPVTDRPQNQLVAIRAGTW